MTIEEARLAKARAQANQVRMLNEILITILLAAILLPLIGEIYLVTFEPAPWAQQIGAPLAVATKLISYAPALAAAAAVIALRNVFAEYKEGRFLSPKASSAFQRAGVWALIAFLLKMLIAPLAVSLLGGEAFNWRFDPLDIALMAFAISVFMIGGVLEAAAAALKAENDQIV
jgi:hypothetical protein